MPEISEPKTIEDILVTTLFQILDDKSGAVPGRLDAARILLQVDQSRRQRDDYARSVQWQQQHAQTLAGLGGIGAYNPFPPHLQHRQFQNSPPPPPPVDGISGG